MKSICYCPPAIQGALQEASPTDSWVPTEFGQIYFFEFYGSKPEPGLEEYLKTTTETNTVKFREWFANNGFPMDGITIPPGGKAVGSIFDLLVTWEKPGFKHELHTPEGVGYEGVKMNHGFTAYEIKNSDNLLLQIPVTNENWEVYLFQEDKDTACNTPYRLPEHTKTLLERKGVSKDIPGGIIFPQVDLEQTVDISYFVGLTSDEFEIDEAIKKIRLKVDEKGAHAEAAVAFACRTALNPDQPYIINDTFLVIFKHKEHKHPAFVAQVAPEDGWIKKKTY